MALRLAMSTSASSAMVCCGRSQMMRYPKSLPAIGGKGMPVPPVPPLDALAAHWWPLDAMTDPRARAPGGLDRPLTCRPETREPTTPERLSDVCSSLNGFALSIVSLGSWEKHGWPEAIVPT
jgi:hypothetical protein